MYEVVAVNPGESTTVKAKCKRNGITEDNCLPLTFDNPIKVRKKTPSSMSVSERSKFDANLGTP